MTTPEAQRLAEELRDACMKIRVKASIPLSALIPIMQRAADELDRLASLAQPADQPMIPLSAIRPIAVEAIREVMGCPDVRGKDGNYLVETLEEVSAAAAKTFAAIQSATPGEPQP